MSTSTIPKITLEPTETTFGLMDGTTQVIKIVVPVSAMTQDQIKNNTIYGYYTSEFVIDYSNSNETYIYMKKDKYIVLCIA